MSPIAQTEVEVGKCVQGRKRHMVVFTHIVILFRAVSSDVVCMFVQQQCVGSVRLNDDIFHLGTLILNILKY